MGAIDRIDGKGAMATKWRRRTMCVLLAGEPAPATLRSVSATGAFLETNARPAAGAKVELRHPDAGAIAATVRALCDDGIELGFACSEASVAFALSAIAADMSRP